MHLPADDEAARQRALERFRVLGSQQEQAYDDVTRLAANVCGTQIALIALSDRKRPWFQSRIERQITRTPREHDFCHGANRTPQRLLLVEDTLLDPRFATHPCVTGAPNIRFYAAAPLLTDDGQEIGTVCAIDHTPHRPDARQLETLQFLACEVIRALEKRLNALDDITRA